MCTCAVNNTQNMATSEKIQHKFPYKKVNLFLEKLESKINNNNYNSKQIIMLDEPYECPVCMEMYNVNQSDNLVKLDCSHIFCCACVEKIKKDSVICCPMCRTSNFLKSFGIDSKNIVLTDEMIEKFKNDFLKVSNASEKYSQNRTNFLNYSYVLQKLLVLNNIVPNDNITNTYFHNPHARAAHDNMWEKISKDLNWI